MLSPPRSDLYKVVIASTGWRSADVSTKSRRIAWPHGGDGCLQTSAPASRQCHVVTCPHGPADAAVCWTMRHQGCTIARTIGGAHAISPARQPRARREHMPIRSLSGGQRRAGSHLAASHGRAGCSTALTCRARRVSIPRHFQDSWSSRVAEHLSSKLFTVKMFRCSWRARRPDGLCGT